MSKGILGELDSPFPVSTLPVGNGGERGLFKIVAGEGFELKNPAPAHKGLVYFKEGVFGGCTYKNYGSVFYPGKEGILLGPVPAVYFVNKENGPFFIQASPFVRSGDRFTDLLDSGEYCVESNETAFCVIGYNPGQGGLAGTGRSVENDR